MPKCVVGNAEVELSKEELLDINEMYLSNGYKALGHKVIGAYLKQEIHALLTKVNATLEDLNHVQGEYLILSGWHDVVKTDVEEALKAIDQEQG